MTLVLLQILPFFALIGLGFYAGRIKFFSPEATASLSKFVFYFALSAMLFRFAANLSLAEILDWPFVGAYICGTGLVYLLATAVALFRRIGLQQAAIEAQTAVIGNVGFLGVPMLVALLGINAIGPVMLVLSVDLILFGSLAVIVITGSQKNHTIIAVLQSVGIGLLKNPMIVSISLGILWSGFHIPIPKPMNEFLEILGAAATPGALFVIGASLATKSAEKLQVAGWLTFCKLAMHPAAVAFFALIIFPVDHFAAGVMITTAALPVAGNVYMLAQHYGIAPQRVSAAILMSTTISIFTLTVILEYVLGLSR